ncbi:MAG: winged helix-turn-helix domain-containing protein, partial [Candidatus Bathyarchaeia archaeon]
MAIEDVLSSKGRVRILRILAEIGELSTSAIARRAGLNYATTLRHLEALERAGLFQHKVFGRIRIFRFIEGNPRARIVKDLVDIWDEAP